MKTNPLNSLVPAVLALACSVPAISMAAPRDDLLGQTEPATAASRSITITPETKYVNVEGGQTVLFKVGDQTFAWNFDGPVSSFELNRVAPPGLLDHVVTAYVAPNPLYVPGGRR